MGGIYCLCRAHYFAILYELNISTRSMRTVHKSTFHTTSAIFSDKPVITQYMHVLTFNFKYLNIWYKNQHTLSNDSELGPG